VRLTEPSAHFGLQLFSLPILFIAFCVAIVPAASAEQDLQSWNAVEYTHRVDENWALGLQGEVRFKDNISTYSEAILKPAAYYYFSDEFYLGLGYKHISENDKANEQDIWQEIHLKQPLGRLELQHQVRLEQRFIGDVDGIIPRLRYLIEATYPFHQDKYLVASEAARFNLVDKGTGPVSGFEQNRLYFGLGFHANTSTKLEFGYLWRYEKERASPNKSDHAIRVQIKFNSDGRN
jgi:hypothetical protein